MAQAWCDPGKEQPVQRPIPLVVNQVDHFHIDREQNVSPIASDARLDENNVSPAHLKHKKFGNQIATPQRQVPTETT